MSIKGQPAPWLRAAVIVLSLLRVAVPAHAQQAGPTPDPTRFEKGVLAYEAADAAAPPRRTRSSWLATPSSSAGRRSPKIWPATTWSIAASIRSSPGPLYFTDRLVLRYKPRLIVLHIGGNDVHNGQDSRAGARRLQDVRG